MRFATTDLSDEHPDAVVAEPLFADFGGRSSFSGPIETVKVFEDNVLVKATLQTPGEGRVLVVDAGGSMRCALVGDVLAQIAIDNEWAGILMYGCVRDTAMTRTMPIGIKALGVHPKRSEKHGAGQRSIEVAFAGARFRPGAWLYADADGILTSPVPIHD
ncbi:MAG TPA: ribonuclease E activity regulator RraA [Acidimicrobiia bacterium]|jgi:regulator of ribonuclease activity A